MIDYIGIEPLGENGSRLLSIAKLYHDNGKPYYLLSVTDTKTTQIHMTFRLTKDHLKMFKKLVNDASLEGMKI